MAEKMSGSKCRSRGSRKDNKGQNQRRKAGLPAKSGRRALPKRPGENGGHVTTAHDRKRGKMLASMGLKFYKRPNGWINHGMKETS